MLRAPFDATAPTGDPMEQDEPDVVELQDSDEGDMVRRVFIGEGETPKVEGGIGGLQVTPGNFGGSRHPKKGVQGTSGGLQTLEGIEAFEGGSKHF